MKGFTLIELIVVISVTAVLSIVGIAAFVTYSRSQTLTASAQDVVSVLNVAKSRAQSQVKPNDGVCASGEGFTPPLDGYKVTITSSNTYELSAFCAGNEYKIKEYEEKKLRPDVTFSSSVGTAFFFSVLSGSVEGATELEVSAYGKTKAITVGSSGIIQIVD